MTVPPGPPYSPEYLAQTNHPYLSERVSIAFILIDTFFLLLFYVSFYFNRKSVGVPMVVCNTLAYVFCMGSAATGILMPRIGGAGHHVQAVPIQTFQNWLKLSKVLEFTYTPSVMFAKLAALFLYYQVFDVPIYRRVFIGIGVVLIMQGIISLVLGFSICRPFRYFWTQAVDVHDGTCGNVMLFYKSYSIPSLVTDVAMLIVPWPILIKLNMPWGEKFGLILTFLAASLGIITCTIRFTVFFTVPLFSDATWYASGGPTIYALVEPSIYMIASILPTMRHLINRVRRKAKETSQRRSSKGDTTGRSASVSRTEDAGGEAATRGMQTGESRVARPEIWQIDPESSEEEDTPEDWDPKQTKHNRHSDTRPLNLEQAEAHGKEQ